MSYNSFLYKKVLCFVNMQNSDIIKTETIYDVRKEGELFLNKVGIVACSNAQLLSYKADIDSLDKILRDMGFQPVYSEYIYEKEPYFSGTSTDKAKALMELYKAEDIVAIFDVSGGDMANEILPYLDYECIANTDKKFWGYSDLTTIINAIYAKTGKSSMLYQVKNLVWDKTRSQIGDFVEYANKTLLSDDIDNKAPSNEPKDEIRELSLLEFDYDFIQGETLKGIVIGGNIRCFLKLAGTEYMPDFTDKVLLLESLGGEVPQMITYLNQLQQMGAFSKISGIILGTFTTMEANKCKPDIIELVRRYAGDKLPIVKTDCIGHGSNSKAIAIGTAISLKSNEGDR